MSDKPTVLLTGGLGFIGQFAEHILAQDAEVICPIRRSEAGPRKWITYVPCDLMDDVMVAKLPKVDIVVNLAAEAHVEPSLAAPVNHIRRNVEIITNVMEYARRNSVGRVVHLSTDEVFGLNRRGEPFVNPNNPYAAGKAAQEAVVRAYAQSFGVRAVILNTQNVYGVGQPEAKFIPTIIRKLLAGDPVPLYGGIEAGRNWTWAGDVARTLSVLAGLTRPRHAVTMGQSYGETSVFPLHSQYGEVGRDFVNHVELIDRIARMLDVPARFELAGDGRVGYETQRSRISHLPVVAGERADFGSKLIDVVAHEKKRLTGSW